MEIIKIANSSAIAQISFDCQNHQVGVAFTYNPDKEYYYYCNEIENIKSQIEETETSGGSVGKLINIFRKDGTFEEIKV